MDEVHVQSIKPKPRQAGSRLSYGRQFAVLCNRFALNTVKGYPLIIAELTQVGQTRLFRRATC